MIELSIIPCINLAYIEKVLNEKNSKGRIMIRKKGIPSFFWISLSVSLLIISGAFTYYFVYHLPKIKHTQLELEKIWSEAESEQNRQQTFQDCAKEAREKAESRRDTMIESGILSSQELSEYIKAKEVGLTLKKDYDSYFDRCLKKYGIKY